MTRHQLMALQYWSAIWSFPVVSPMKQKGSIKSISKLKENFSKFCPIQQEKLHLSVIKFFCIKTIVSYFLESVYTMEKYFAVSSSMGMCICSFCQQLGLLYSLNMSSNVYEGCSEVQHCTGKTVSEAEIYLLPAVENNTLDHWLWQNESYFRFSRFWFSEIVYSIMFITMYHFI